MNLLEKSSKTSLFFFVSLKPFMHHGWFVMSRIINLFPTENEITLKNLALYVFLKFMFDNI